MPFERNPRFTGRESELSRLESLLAQTGRTTKVAITGLGGVGKTQLAIELVHRAIEKRKDCSVFWIPVTDQESLHQAYLAVAEELSIPGWDKDGTDVKHLVQEYLSKSSAGQWLLVFDNADDIDIWMHKPTSTSEKRSGRRLLDYLPRSTQGSIIFTTRNWKVAVKLAPQNIVEVSEMSEEIAKELLKKCLISSDISSNLTDIDRSSKDLLAQLTYLPLAIVQASAYINENRISIADYISLLAEKDESTIELLSEDFEDDSRYPDIKNPVATTWLISFEQILQRDTLAAEYLSFMACVEPKDIPESLLPAGPSQKKRIEAIGTLIAYSFVTRRPANSVLDLHRLVHLATRNWLLENSHITKWSSKVISRLVEVFPNDEHENRATWRAYLPHASYALLSIYVGQNREDNVELLHKLGMCLLSDGRFDEAESYLLEAMEIRKRTLGEEHSSTLTGVNNLAMVLQNQGKYEAAEEMNRRALEGREKLLGKEHPDTLTSVGDLAMALYFQGKYKMAEERNRRALEGREKMLGVEHPSTLMSVNNLALVLERQGKYEEAEDLNRQGLAGTEKVLGVEHPSTLTSVSNLALVLYKQGKYEEAEGLDRRALAGREKVLGVEHPDTLTSVNNLALALERQGKYEEAEGLSRRDLAGSENMLGVEHPATLMSVNNLAMVLKSQGKYSEAEGLNRRALAGREKALGAEHPDTLTSVSDLASALERQGKYEEAEGLNRRNLAGSEKVLGVEHPDTFTSVNNLAFILQRQGKYEEAEGLNRRALAGYEKVLGVEHPATLMSVGCLAFLLENIKQYDRAAELYQRACSGFERVLGRHHPTTISCFSYYADLQRKRSVTLTIPTT
jgi:tetratricopeptide (TPR) repeat protein